MWNADFPVFAPPSPAASRIACYLFYDSWCVVEAGQTDLAPILLVISHPLPPRLAASKEEIKFLHFRHCRPFAARHRGVVTSALPATKGRGGGEKGSAQWELIDSDAIRNTRGRMDVSDFQWWKRTVTSDTHDSADSDICKRRL